MVSALGSWMGRGADAKDAATGGGDEASWRGHNMSSLRPFKRNRMITIYDCINHICVFGPEESSSDGNHTFRLGLPEPANFTASAYVKPTNRRKRRFRTGALGSAARKRRSRAGALGSEAPKHRSLAGHLDRTLPPPGPPPYDMVGAPNTYMSPRY